MVSIGRRDTLDVDLFGWVDKMRHHHPVLSFTIASHSLGPSSILIHRFCASGRPSERVGSVVLPWTQVQSEFIRFPSAPDVGKRWQNPHTGLCSKNACEKVRSHR